MSAVRSYGTRPEKRVCSALHSQGFRFRLHSKQLPRSPDVLLRKFKAVISISTVVSGISTSIVRLHTSRKPAANSGKKKFVRNVLRDQKVMYQLKMLGWRVAIIWESGLIKKQQDDTL